MSRIIGINGSPRINWNCAQALDKALEGAAAAGAEVFRHDLYRLSYTGCRSCFACKRIGSPSFGKCSVQDDLKPVLDDILRADGLILSSPIYFGSDPGVVRSFCERLWFPSHTYSTDGTVAYDRHLTVGLIYTMNVPTDTYYSRFLETEKGMFEEMVGPTQILSITDTLQFEDYSKYASAAFDPDHKRQHHDQVFSNDLERAYEFGKALLG
ncbi:MAG: flavodoxin family protein [Oscillospiraceae bacterium]|nr:flavodoxin family protein [Oscillospiraceae bacterium]